MKVSNVISLSKQQKIYMDVWGLGFKIGGSASNLTASTCHGATEHHGVDLLTPADRRIFFFFWPPAGHETNVPPPSAGSCRSLNPLNDVKGHQHPGNRMEKAPLPLVAPGLECSASSGSSMSLKFQGSKRGAPRKLLHQKVASF